MKIKRMKKLDLLKQSDFEEVSTGETKAENTIAWGRNKLKERGLIFPNSQHDIWKLTEKGIMEAKKLNLA